MISKPECRLRLPCKRSLHSKAALMSLRSGFRLPLEHEANLCCNDDGTMKAAHRLRLIRSSRLAHREQVPNLQIGNPEDG
jgi:hypothetical protein